MVQRSNVKDTYRRAITWIANNDEPADMNVDTVKDLISVVLIADLFDMNPATVALDVIERRKL